MDTPDDARTLKIAAVADLHVGRHGEARYARMFAEMAEQADVLILAGDLTDTGQEEEARLLADELRTVDVTRIAVLGNHDYDSGQPQIVHDLLEDAGVIVLDGDSYTAGGVSFAGVKGFAGGFGKRMLSPFGEQGIKSFVEEAEHEATKLEHALAQAGGGLKVVVLHYAPTRDTVVGEDPEIFPFLGSSRLERAIDGFQAALVIHGHAHHGTAEGRTAGGIPVYNVALPLLQRAQEGRGFRVFELTVTPEPAAGLEVRS